MIDNDDEIETPNLTPMEVELFGGPCDGLILTLPSLAGMLRRPRKDGGWYVWKRNMQMRDCWPVRFEYAGVSH